MLILFTFAYLFSIAGHASIHRRFFVHHSYAGCNNDYGWFVNVDTPNPACNWEQHWTNANTWPTFLVVKDNKNINYLTYNQIELADSIGIFTKPAKGTGKPANVCTHGKLN